MSDQQFKLLLDNGFAVFFAVFCLSIIFYMIRSSEKRLDRKEAKAQQDMFKVFEKYENVSRENVTAISSITHAFQQFINQNKDEMIDISSRQKSIHDNVIQIDKKLDILNDTQLRILSKRKRK